jgi:hypothetical protein
MNANALSIPAPIGVVWIDLETAAERSGKSVGHIRRLCGDRWMGEGLAKLEQPAGGGKSSWFVREDADPGFSRVKFAEQLTKQFDMRTVSTKARNKATERQRIVQLWQADVAAGRQLRVPETQITAKFIERMKIEEGKNLSRATLFNWQRAARDGIQGLINVYGNGGTGSEIEAPDPFLEAVKRFWLRESRPPLKTCYDFAVRQAKIEGWAVCSFKTIQRRIDTLPQQLVIKKRYGETAFVNQVLPPARRDYRSIDSNSWWCSDHHQFDCWVLVGKDEKGKPKYARPWITGWEDLRSRKIVGWHIFAHDPNQSTILLSLRSGCLAHGVPQHVYIDNGKDYDCYTLQGVTKAQRQRTMAGQRAVVRRRIKVQVDGMEVGGVLGALDIKLTHAIAFNAKAKPIERFFNTVCNRFTKFVDTYCGRNPQERPENLPDKMGNALTIEEFADRFDTWLEADYHERVHGGDAMDGLTPNAAFEQFMVRRRVAREEDLQLLIARTSKPITVDREGVIWRGIRYGKGDAALFPYFKKKVFLRIDPSDISCAAAFTEDDRFIACLAANWDLPFGATDEEFRRAERDRKNTRELTNRYLKLGPQRRRADVMETMALNRADDARKQLPAPGLIPVRTSLEGQFITAEAMQPREQHRPKMIDMVAAAGDLGAGAFGSSGSFKMADFFEDDQ